MIRLRRRLLIDTAILGAGLTMLVVLLSRAGLLDSLENWAYDRRARYCQFFAKAPTTQVVHLDIDDSTTDPGAMGTYPWPREQFTILLDELRVAQPKVVALDITFKAAGSGDDAFAAALRGLGRAMVPVDLSLKDPSKLPPIERAIHDELALDPALSQDELTRRLAAKGIPPAAVTDDAFIAARRQAVFDRIAELSRTRQPPLAEVRAKLLPAGSVAVVGTNSPLSHVIDDQYARVSATLAVARLTAPAPPAAPITHVPNLLSQPLTAFGNASVGTGFVSDTFFQDGAVRALPLAVEVGGRVYPQFGLSIACQMLDVDPAAVRYTERSVIIPRPGGNNIVIPTRPKYSKALGENVEQVIDIPWFGTTNWTTMYDFPKHAATAQHVPLVRLWDVHVTQERIINNNLNADRAVSLILDNDKKNKLALDPPRAKEYAAHLPEPSDTKSRKEMARFTLAQLKDAGWIEQYASMKEADFTEDSLRQRDDLFNGKAALELILKENDDLLAQIASLRADLSSKLRGKAVLIGWTATSAAADFVPTPLHDKCPGVVVHGAIFNAIMTQHFWRRAPEWVTIAITIVLGLATAFTASGFSPFRAALVAILLLGTYLIVNGILLFDYAGIIVGVGTPMVAIAAAWAGCTLRRIYLEAQERALITKRFSNYADPMLVDYVIEHPDQIKFEGERKELTVVFTDLQGFTTISEKLGEKSVLLLNEYMGIMVPIIGRNLGYVNKFLGDGIMFFFGAPLENKDHAAVALKTVLEMQEVMPPFNDRLAAQGLPPLIMRAGISTGEMVVGDAGSADRSDYTVLGDAVNLGARLESGNKAIGTRLLANGRTKELGGDGLLLRPVGSFCYLGKSEGVATYEVVGRAAKATPAQLRLAELSTELVDAFAAAKFEQCMMVIGRIETEFGPGKLTKLYRELVEKYLSEGPPVGFCGNIVLSEK